MRDLLKLYSFESVHNSDDEKNIADWIENWLKVHNKPYQRLGNCLYHFENNCVILSAHLDQVKTNGKAVHFRMSDERYIKAYNSKWEQTSLGADDKNGVWIILKSLEDGLDFDWVISDGEESGCIGINNLDNNGVLDCIKTDQICLVLDRKGNTDILKGGSTGAYCSTLAQDLCNFSNSAFEVTTGSLSDTSVLCQYCESVNMSVAYFNPHRANEYTDFVALQCIKDFVQDVVENFAHYSTDPSVYLTTTTTTKTKLPYNYKQYYTDEYGDDYNDWKW